MTSQKKTLQTSLRALLCALSVEIAVRETGKNADETREQLRTLIEALDNTAMYAGTVATIYAIVRIGHLFKKTDDNKIIVVAGSNGITPPSEKLSDWKLVQKNKRIVLMSPPIVFGFPELSFMCDNLDVVI